MQSVGISNGMSMTVSELKELLLKAAEGLGYVNSENEAINVLLNMLESLPTDVADVTVRIGGELPTDIGVYLVGAVSADGNYTTDFAVGAVVITPDGIKADLAWNQNDDNYIVTNTLLNTKDENGNYLFDTAAHAYAVAEPGDLDEATEQVAEFFLGVDIDGNITLETDQTKLNVGAYVEVAMIANWGNVMYYSEPIARPLVVVAETLNVDFVTSGEINNERHFEFYNVPHDEMEGKENLLVTYKKDGNGYKAGDVVTDYNVKYVYVGVQTNGMPYASTTAPTHAGAYTITAIVTVRDETGYITHAGQGIGALVIEPSESTTNVENEAIKWDGNEHTVNQFVTVDSVNVPGLNVDKTVISAGLSADLDANIGLEAIEGNVNVDMPAWLDNVMTKLGLLEAGYTDTGITAETFLGYVEKIQSGLAELGVETEAFNKIVSVIEQLPGKTTLTFHDDKGYTDVGVYLIVGIVTDSDHYPSADAGIMVIYPDATKAELEYAQTWDENNVFTWNYLENYDLNAQAYLNGEFDKDLTDKTVNLFVGFADHGELVLTDTKTALDNGVYAEVSFLLVLDNTMYYAEPISREVIIVPNPATIDFVTETGEVNNARHFVYNNLPHAMDNIRVTLADGTVYDLKAGDEGVDIYYVGVQTNGKPYASTEAPTNAGVYEVTAQYTERDTQNRVVNLGVGVGALVIEPAKAEIVVDNAFHEVGPAFETESMITVSSDVDVTIDKTIITVMLNTDGTFSETGLDAIQGAVNMDLPKWLDDVLANYSIFENGLTVAEFKAAVESVKADLEELGINTEILDRLVDVTEQFPATAEVTFLDQAEIAPTAVGAYLVIGVITDSNFYPAMDAGLLVIYPDVNKTELTWIYEDINNNNIYTEDTLKVVDLGAEADIEAANELINNWFFGVDAENWKITLVDNQEELNIGVYEEFSFIEPNVNSVIYYAEPISRPVIVVANVYNVQVEDALYEFDNTEKGIDNITVTTASGESVDITGGTLTVTYFGLDTQLRPYCSTEKPVHAGTYTVLATYIGVEADGDQAVGSGVGTLIIERADADVHVESHAVLHGQDYDFEIEVFHDAIDDECKILTIIAGVDMSAYTTEGVIGIDGTVNVDFPEPIDEVLGELFPELYVNGIGTDAFFAKYDEMVAAIEEHGYAADLLKQLREMLTKLNAVNLTFNETVKPTDTGMYAVVAMTFDPDYKSAVDTALIAIAPNATVADLDFSAKIPSFLGLDILPYEMVADFDFSAFVDHFASTDSGMSAEDVVVNDVIFGLTSDLKLFIGSSEEKPDEMGIYDQIAYVPTTENNVTLALPILRDFVIVDSTANVEFYDGNGYTNWLRNLTYNGQPQGMDARLALADGTILSETPNVWYLGIENGIVFYSSSEAPTNAGAYQVIGYYFDSEANIYTIGLGAMVINPREVTVTMDDKTITVGDALPEWTYTTDNLVPGDSLTVHGSTEADGTVAGTFDITAEVEFDPNYVVTVENGTLTVLEKEITGTITSGYWTMSLDSVVYLNYYPVMENFGENIDFSTAGGVVIWIGSEAPSSRYDLEIGKDNCLVIEGMYQNENGEWFVRTHEIYAKNLGDMVYIRPYVEVAPGEYVYMDAAPYYSPARYCYDILNNLNERQDTRYVCAALLKYGASAQVYFEYDTENLVTTIPERWANIDLSIYDLDFKEGYLDALYVDDHIKALAATLTGNRTGIEYCDSTLDLQGAIRLSTGFNVDSSVIDWTQVKKAEVLFWTESDCANLESLAYELGNYSYSCELTAATGDEEVYLGDYLAKSHHILAKNLGETVYYSCRIEMNDGTVYRSGLVYYSPEAFVADHLASSEGQIIDICERIAVYSEMARIRFMENK